MAGGGAGARPSFFSDLPPPPWIIGHRGAAGEAPENTLPSFLLAVAQGADMVEIDLQLTADGVLMVVHDFDLLRLAGVALVVEESGSAALREHPVGFLGGAPCWLPRLDEVLGALPAGLPLNLELKRRRASRERVAAALVAASAGESARLLVSSFDWPLLALVRARLPDLALAPLAEREPRALLAAGRELGAASLHCHHRLASRALAAAARRDGRPLLAYTVDEPQRARRLFSAGVAGVFTDRPGFLRRALAEGP